jgi:hypothetical protein
MAIAALDLLLVVMLHAGGQARMISSGSLRYAAVNLTFSFTLFRL